MNARFLVFAQEAGFDVYFVQANSVDEGQHWFSVIHDREHWFSVIHDREHSVAVDWAARQQPAENVSRHGI